MRFPLFNSRAEQTIAPEEKPLSLLERSRKSTANLIVSMRGRRDSLEREIRRLAGELDETEIVLAAAIRMQDDLSVERNTENPADVIDAPDLNWSGMLSDMLSEQEKVKEE